MERRLFFQKKALPKTRGGLLVSRFRDDDVRPSLFFPDCSQYDFLDLVRANNIRMAKEVLRVFTRAILPTDILNPEMMGALNKNPFAPKVPCHRVVSSNGKIGGFALGIKEKIKLLKEEGVEVKNGKIVNFNNMLFKF